VIRRAKNASVEFKRAWGFLASGRLEIRLEGREFASGLTLEDFQELKEGQKLWPFRLGEIGERTYWYFQDCFYWEDDGLDADELYALLVSRQQRERGRIERAKAMVAMGMQPQDQAQRRDVIPDDVKQLVWLRDGGRCRHCGAQAELQFDHIIPFSMGGSSNPENLQILCGPCNRRKSAGLTIPMTTSGPSGLEIALAITQTVATVLALIIAVWALVATYRERTAAESAAVAERRAIFELTVLRDLLHMVGHYHTAGSPIAKALLSSLPKEELPRMRVCSSADDRGEDMKDALMRHLDAEGYSTHGSPERRAGLALADEIRQSMERRA
jgi:hypothetical protein